MQAQIFPRGTYAPTMGVFSLGQDPRGMADNMQTLFGTPTTSSTATTSSSSKTKSREPQFSAAKFASMRSTSPPVSQSSHSSSSDEYSEEEEGSVVDHSTCNPNVSGKLSRAFKSLRKIGGK